MLLAAPGEVIKRGIALHDGLFPDGLPLCTVQSTLYSATQNCNLASQPLLESIWRKVCFLVPRTVILKVVDLVDSVHNQNDRFHLHILLFMTFAPSSY